MSLLLEGRQPLAPRDSGVFLSLRQTCGAQVSERKSLLTGNRAFSGRVLVVAFEGWNDAGEAASSAVRTLHDHLEVVPLFARKDKRSISAIQDDLKGTSKRKRDEGGGEGS